jgi:hypothetical protein
LGCDSPLNWPLKCGGHPKRLLQCVIFWRPTRSGEHVSCFALGRTLRTLPRREKEEPKSDPHSILNMDTRHSRFSSSSLYPRTTGRPSKHLKTSSRCRASATGTTPRQNLGGRIACVPRTTSRRIRHTGMVLTQRADSRNGFFTDPSLSLPSYR